MGLNQPDRTKSNHLTLQRASKNQKHGEAALVAALPNGLDNRKLMVFMNGRLYSRLPLRCRKTSHVQFAPGATSNFLASLAHFSQRSLR